MAANGSIYYKTPVLLAPGPAGRLDLLAGDSIYGGNAPLMRSGASLDTLASPYRPAFVGMVKNGNFNSAIWGPNTLSQDGSYGERVLFAFGSPAAAPPAPGRRRASTRWTATWSASAAAACCASARRKT